MTKTFDILCNDLLKEMVNPTQPQQNTQTQQPTQQNTTVPPQNNMDYKKVWDSVSKLNPEHLTQLMNDLTKHLQTVNPSQQQQTNATANKQV